MAPQDFVWVTFAFLSVLCFMPVHCKCDLSGWFGDSCIYQCHCQNGICNEDGDCSGSSCERGWFGPQCQYRDMVTNRDQLADGDDLTCMTIPKSNYDLQLSYNDVRFTWMRIVTDEPGLFRNLTFTFKTEAGHEVSPTDLKRIPVDLTVLEVYGDLPERIASIEISLDDPALMKHMCSVYVSGGRNVALKQNTDQSSAYKERSKAYTAALAVDGNTNQYFSGQSCTHTKGAPSNWWNMTFSRLVHVNRYRLYNRNEHQCRLDFFKLKTNNGGTQLQDYQENKTRADVYDVLFDAMVTSMEISVDVTRRPRYYNSCEDKTFLTLCEVQAFGDVVCAPGHWGRECNQTCNCENSTESCYVSTGMCPSGCRAGYHGPGCKTPCPVGFYGDTCSEPCPVNCFNDTCNKEIGFCSSCEPGWQGVNCDRECDKGRYGKDCQQFCSLHCFSGTCDRFNGECENGCAEGFLPPLCEDECKDGFHGFNCTEPCSQNCAQGLCNNVNGSCKDCVPGYKGSICDEECSDRFYGVNCMTPCDNKCADQLCHHVTGKCDNCPAGKKGDKCDQDCEDGSYGPRCTQICSKQCDVDGVCDKINGTCLQGCKAGYITEKCDRACDKKFYGKNCIETCSVNCVVDEKKEPTVCHNENGKCLLGCQSGFGGITCEAVETAVNPAVIAVPIIAVLLLVVMILIGFFYWRRRKRGAPSLALHNGETGEESPKPARALSLISTNGHKDFHNGGQEKQFFKHHNQEVQAKAMPIAAEVPQDNVYCNNMDIAPSQSETSIPAGNLGAYLASHDMDFFVKQFDKIPNSTATTSDAESAENKHKNRYKNVLAYDHSRVRLQADPEKKWGDYYNASFVQGYDGEVFIASQAPNKTVINDFIRMIWEKNVYVVVMLTNLAEQSKAKCEMYWPEEDEVEFGEIKVRLAATQVLADYTVRTLQLMKVGEPVHTVTQFHFTSWPDKGVPETPWALVDFEQVVNSYKTDHPILVHCSAGVGRTGTFIALRNVMKQSKETGYLDFHSTLSKLRQDRVFMIQTAEQYRFLHEAAQVALLCQDAMVTTDDFSNRMEVLRQKVPSGDTNMEREFRMVCSLVAQQKAKVEEKSEENDAEYSNSRLATNKLKNRFSNILPKDDHRPRLTTDTKDGSDYINAVLVPSMSKLRQQILTQLPLPTTVVDLWRLVTQYDVSLIVAFDLDSSNQDATIGDYLPGDRPEPILCGQFEVSGDKVTSGRHWEKQKLKVLTQRKKKTRLSSSTPPKEERSVNHLKCTVSNLTAEDWLVLVSELRSMAPPGQGRILYMCRNGADLSGFACVLSLLLSRVDHDHFLTVPLVVGEIKSIRPQVIPTKDQYQLLYEVLQLHYDSSHVYTNFKPNINQTMLKSAQQSQSTEALNQKPETKTKEQQQQPAKTKHDYTNFIPLALADLNAALSKENEERRAQQASTKPGSPKPSKPLRSSETAGKKEKIPQTEDTNVYQNSAEARDGGVDNLGFMADGDHTYSNSRDINKIREQDEEDGMV